MSDYDSTTPGGVVAVLEHNIPNTPQTTYHTASVSKQFIAFAILLLAEQGKLSLDDDIRKHLPELHDFGTPATEIGELGALYGRTRGYAAIALGVSVVAFDVCPNDDDSCFTLGLPVVAEAALSSKFIGLGAQVFGNVNRKASYAGATVFLQLGRTGR